MGLVEGNAALCSRRNLVAEAMFANKNNIMSKAFEAAGASKENI